jgi:hypothetical protein
MAITVKHKFVSAIPDSGDTTIVQPSNWNDTHDLVGTVPVANGGTGAATLTGYVKGNGTAAMTAASTIPNTDVTGLGTASTKDAGVANGVATLDSSGQVPLSQIPPLGDLNYQGAWNANTNSPTLTSSVGTKGFYYVVSVAGTTNLNGITDWQVGDWAVFNGSVWQKIDNTDAVTSVNGYTGTVVLGYGDITTGVVPVANGGTGVTTSSGANSVVLRDANGNITTNCLFEGYVTQAASGTTINLTAASAQNYQITGSGGQTIKLPNATTLPNGAIFTFNNNQSSGAITVVNNSNTTISTINSGGYVAVVLLDNSIAAGSWDRHDSTPSNVSWSTNTLDYAGSITSATWNGTTVQVNRGGTGATTLTGYVKGSGTSALTASATIPTTDLSGTITNAQLANSAITINGTSTSLGGSISVGTVTSVTGTSPVVSSGGTTPAISMPAATSSVNGYLTSADWTTFNNKQPAGSYLTAVTADAPLSGSGTSGSHLVIAQANTSTSGYLSSTDWNTFNNKGSGTVTSVTGTAPVVSSGGATPAISMAAATGSVNGYLTSTDWTTFNGKAPAVTYTTNYVPFGQGTTTPNLSSSFTYVTGTGTLTAPAVSASNGLVINSNTVAASYSIPSGSSASSVGPMTVASGQSVTIPSGSRWVVL